MTTASQSIVAAAKKNFEVLAQSILVAVSSAVAVEAHEWTENNVAGPDDESNSGGAADQVVPKTIWDGCIGAVSSALERSLQSLPASKDQGSNLKLAARRMQALLKQLDRQFSSLPWREVPRSWRRCSTDASLLYVCAVVCTIMFCDWPTSTEDPTWDRLKPFSIQLRDLIRTLDMCLIVTGAPGCDRRDYVHALIKILQALHSSSSDVEANDGSLQAGAAPNSGPTRKKARIDTRDDAAVPNRATLPGPVRAQAEVPELPEDPDLMSFLERHSHRPFVVRNWAREWPARLPSHESTVDAFAHNDIFQARWESGDYLRRLAGVGRVVPVEIGRAYTDTEWTQDIISWDEFLLRAGWEDTQQEENGSSTAEESQDRAPTTYLAQHTLLTQFPELACDMMRPDLVYSCPPAPTWMPEYQAPQDTEHGGGEDVIVNAWIGPAGTLSPAHTDPYYNLYVQVVGEKHFWLAPPCANEKGGMYHFSSGTTVNGFTTSREDPPSSGAADSYMENTSQLEVFAPTVCGAGERANSDDPFPLFTKHVEPEAMSTILYPGDLLYIPPKWWHAVKSLSRSISISHFF